MSKKKVEVVKSTTEPNKNDIWFNGKELKYFGKKGWEDIIKTSDIPAGDGAGSGTGTSARELYVDLIEQGLTDEQKAYNIETINLIDEGKVPNVFVRNNGINIPFSFDYTGLEVGQYIFSLITTGSSEAPSVSGIMNKITILPTGDTVFNQEYILGIGYNDNAFPILYKEIDRNSIETLTRNDFQDVVALVVIGQPSNVLYLSQSWYTMVYRSSLIKDGDRWCIKELEAGESGSVYRTIYFDINEVDNTSN